MNSYILQNKYKKWYDNIIENASVREVDPNEYYESHHIIPECFFINRKRRGPKGWILGDPEYNNKVLLFPQEHFICHVLLSKFTTEIARKKMIFALVGMKRSKSGKRYINSRLYKTARLLMAAETSKMNKGRIPTEITKQKLREAGFKRRDSDETKMKKSLARKGKKLPPEQVEKMRGRKMPTESIERGVAKRRGKKHSKETKELWSKQRKGKPKSKEHAVNISKGLTGYKRGPMPESEKLKRSIAAKGKPSHLKGKKSGQIYSEERRANIAESNRRRGISKKLKLRLQLP